MNTYEPPAVHDGPRSRRNDLEDFAASWGHQLLCAAHVVNLPTLPHCRACPVG